MITFFQDCIPERTHNSQKYLSESTFESRAVFRVKLLHHISEAYFKKHDGFPFLKKLINNTDRKLKWVTMNDILYYWLGKRGFIPQSLALAERNPGRKKIFEQKYRDVQTGWPSLFFLMKNINFEKARQKYFYLPISPLAKKY